MNYFLVINYRKINFELEKHSFIVNITNEHAKSPKVNSDFFIAL